MTAPPWRSRDAAYFAALYDANPDPWNFAGSAYEHRKYQATMAALEFRRFDRAFEIGCSIGVLTRLLASRCASLFAVDIVETALAGARARCSDMQHVRFASLRVPDEWPVGQLFDLILISEVLYFLTPADIARVAAHVTNTLLPGGSVLLVNYTEPIDQPCSGDQAAEIFIAAARPRLGVDLQNRHGKFRIDRLQMYGSARDRRGSYEAGNRDGRA
jgi:cyclopropane fatty-acyl-phospholipid synthase-like methyltransferase